MEFITISILILVLAAVILLTLLLMGRRRQAENAGNERQRYDELLRSATESHKDALAREAESHRAALEREQSRVSDLEKELSDLRTESSALAESLRLNAASALEELRNQYSTKIEELQSENIAKVETLQKENAAKVEELQKQNASLTGQLKAAEEKIGTLKSDREELNLEYEARFKRLAKDILDTNSRTFGEENSRRINDLFQPFKTNFEQFRKDFTESYERENRERVSLLEQLRQLNDSSKTVGAEARRLSDVLKGNTKVQGDWGEMILENILEQSGLTKGTDYLLQETGENDEGKRIRPDALVMLPGKKCIVIDSKVSLKSYFDLANAEAEDEKRRFSAAHVTSVKKHVTELVRKKYQDFIGDNSLDFVMMFIPGEAPYSAAMQAEPGLWDWAYSQRVMMVSPTNLVVSLKLIYQIWSKEKSTANAIAITEEASKMIDKLIAFVEDLEKVGSGIATASKNYESAVNKLRTGRGNLITRAENLRKMGVKAKKDLPASFRNSIPSTDPEEEE